jgi:beta-lactamase class A
MDAFSGRLGSTGTLRMLRSDGSRIRCDFNALSERTSSRRLKELEARSGGRLGAAVLNVATGQLVGNRVDERFAMCSTFKAPAVAFVLARVGRGEEWLDRRIVFTERDLVPPSKPGDIRDTTTPGAMVGTLHRLLLGDALSESSRARLTAWMVEAKDAATRRLRVGLPARWRIANKPGTWERTSTNDIGVIWPPGRDPIVVAAYLGEAPGSVKVQEGILADVARIIADGA